MSAVQYDFSNVTMLDFAVEENAQAMRKAIDAVMARLGGTYACVIAGQQVSGPTTFASINPANPAQVIAEHTAATAQMVDDAIDAAGATFATWSQVPVAERAAVLERGAAALMERRLEFCAWLVLEVGKNYGEADAEVGEAIDFLRFYAQSARGLETAPSVTQMPGERDLVAHVGLGTVAVIPPWNFPLAIMAGMTMAAVVGGNTVVLKPSPDAPTVAAEWLKLMTDCGLPAGVVNLVQGAAEVGARLTSSSKVHGIAFTGSKKVGLEIHELAARRVAGQRFIKRTVLELGGKDAIIVAADADLEQAVAGVVASAYGFSGQKCSACSRVIVDRSIHGAFVEKLVAATEKLSGNDPQANGRICPLINRAAYDRVVSYLEIGKSEGTLLTGGKPLTAPEAGYFIAPTIFDNVDRNARLAQEEVFGPVLAIIVVDGLEEAFTVANDTEYGLTGAIYSMSEQTLARAAREFHVGNLYLNRKCTGAMVGAHPFGGFKLSGTDSKAGGTDYLHHFTQAKSIARNVQDGLA